MNKQLSEKVAAADWHHIDKLTSENAELADEVAAGWQNISKLTMANTELSDEVAAGRHNISKLTFANAEHIQEIRQLKRTARHLEQQNNNLNIANDEQIER